MTHLFHKTKLAFSRSHTLTFKYFNTYGQILKEPRRITLRFLNIQHLIKIACMLECLISCMYYRYMYVYNVKSYLINVCYLLIKWQESKNKTILFFSSYANNILCHIVNTNPAFEFDIIYTIQMCGMFFVQLIFRMTNNVVN